MAALPNLLSACGAEGSTSSASARSSLTWATTGIRALDYARSFDISTGVPLSVSIESLLTFDSDLKLVPLLAESWSQPDPLSYVFKLRSGVTFWDGTELTPDDVVYSLERHRDPDVASEMAYTFDSVESIEATGDDEVTVKLTAPDPFFAYVQTFASITPKAFSEEQGDKLGTPGGSVTTMGTGPYKITEFRADDLVKLERNENYRGDPAPIESIDVKLFTDFQTMQLAMRAGEIDGTFQVPIPDVNQWGNIAGTRLITTPGLNVLSMFFNTTRPPWDDVNVRRAVAYSLDREGLVRELLGGRAEVANSIVPPAQWGALLSDSDVEALYDGLPKFELDLDKAKQALAASSVPEGFATRIQYPTIQPELGKSLLSLQENLSEIGIQLEVNEVPPPQWFTDLEAEKDDIGVIALAPDYPDPANYIGAAYGGGAGNRAHITDPALLPLLQQQRGATDPAVRAGLMKQILQLVEEQVPYLHFWWPDSVMAISVRLEYAGFTPLWYNQIWTENLDGA